MYINNRCIFNRSIIRTALTRTNNDNYDILKSLKQSVSKIETSVNSEESELTDLPSYLSVY